MVKKGRIIIDYDDDINPIRAMHLLHTVMMSGKISESAGVPHYCFASMFYDAKVFTRRKKKGQLADSFIVQNKRGIDDTTNDKDKGSV